MLDLLETRKQMERLTWPFLRCLDEISFANLKYAAWKNHRKKLLMPESKPDLQIFDVDKEMRKAPESEDHMRCV